MIFRSQLMRRIALSVSLLGLVVQPVLAQQQQQDPSQKPRNVKPEVKKAYRDWVEKDVSYIITDAEKRAFKKLETDDERERFIEDFWRRRDPDPDTEENEYREEYYERIAYANEHYSSGVPGWKTDRGRIYITFGKPDEVESHPTGGAYERPSYQGGGDTTTYPFEIWFYRHLDNVGNGIEIEFVDPTGSGEYHIAQSPDEKDAMLNVPGAGLTLNEQLGLANKDDRVLGIAQQNQYVRDQDNPFTRMQIIADLSRPPEVKFKDLESDIAGANSGSFDDNPLNFDMRVDFFRQSDDRVVTAFTIQTDNKDLVFQDSGGVQQARLNIFGRIIGVSGKRFGTFEDPIITRASASELADAKDRKSAYQKAMALPPGTYKVSVIVRDVSSGATGYKNLGFTVPRYANDKLSVSTLVLAARLQNLGDRPPGEMFSIGDKKVIPNVSGKYRRGQEVGIYMQVYNAGVDETTLRPSVDVQYVLMKDGKEIFKQAEDWAGMSDAGERLTLARMLPTDGLVAGDYKLVIRIKDRVSGQTLDPEASFTVVQ
jgi:GWxTD domain-containing protein